MAVTQDIWQAWRKPRLLIRSKLEAGLREDKALATLMGSCVLIFIAQIPGLSRAALLDPSVPLDARLSGALMANLFMVPLFAYGLAAVSHIAARLFGGKGSWFSARMALFWALLAATPLILINGLLAGIMQAGPAATFIGVIVLAGFLYLWISMLIEAER